MANSSSCSGSGNISSPPMSAFNFISQPDNGEDKDYDFYENDGKTISTKKILHNPYLQAILDKLPFPLIPKSAEQSQSAISNKAIEISNDDRTLQKYAKQLLNDLKEAKETGKQEIITLWDPVTQTYWEIVNRLGRKLSKLEIMQALRSRKWLDIDFKGVTLHEWLHYLVLKLMPDVKVGNRIQVVREVFEPSASSADGISLRSRTFGESDFDSSELYKKIEKANNDLFELNQRFVENPQKPSKSLLTDLEKLINSSKMLFNETKIFELAAITPQILELTPYKDHADLSQADLRGFHEAEQLHAGIKEILMNARTLHKQVQMALNQKQFSQNNWLDSILQTLTSPFRGIQNLLFPEKKMTFSLDLQTE